MIKEFMWRNRRLRSLEALVADIKTTLADNVVITKDQAAMVLNLATDAKEGAEENGRDAEANYPHNPAYAVTYKQYAKDLQELIDTIEEQHA